MLRAIMAEGSDRPEPILFATAARGTEGAVRDELRDLGFRGVRADRGGVHFGRSLDEGFRAALELRTALRVLMRLSTFEAPDEDALYEGVSAIDFRPYLTAHHTLAVRAFCRDSRLTHSQFIAQKTKDAIVDQLRARTGARPSVDLDDPDVTLFVHLVSDRATVYLDLTGSSLHKRGWRARALDAPLKESLAAAILRLSGWDRERPLVDPMCGSGTIAIEAALWARQIAPGLARDRFGFERWASHDEAAVRRMKELREQAKAKIRSEQPPIVGSDVDLGALSVARENAAAAGVNVTFRRASIRDLAPLSPPGIMVTNPPYGERLEAPDELFVDLARAIARLRGHRAVILAGAPSIVQHVRTRPSKSLVVYNGDIECRLLTYDVPG
ncbi:23S rRNA (guanine-N-2-) -methyltransferase rlmL [Minicystis rosea]|nr:23S rRNA (guanine-N-2-) -methyltransferase rlmL [Minicystis rosea]